MLFVMPYRIKSKYTIKKHKKNNEGGSDRSEGFHHDEQRDFSLEHTEQTEFNLAGISHLGRKTKQAAFPRCSGINKADRKRIR